MYGNIKMYLRLRGRVQSSFTLTDPVEQFLKYPSTLDRYATPVTKPFAKYWTPVCVGVFYCVMPDSQVVLGVATVHVDAVVL